MTHRKCFCEYDVANMSVRHGPKCPYAEIPLEHSVLDAVQAQIDGEPIFEFNKLDPRLKAMTDEFFERFGRTYQQIARERQAKESEEINFGFYVDGYTLQSTEIVGEIRVISYCGKTTTFPSKQLVAFLERRLSPPNILPEN